MSEQILRAVFGYSSFRPLQKQAIDAVLSGRDCVVVLPTGGGKSLCFQIPALQKGGLTLVVSPLISLMKDQVDTLRALGIGAAFLNSTLSRDEAHCIYDAINANHVRLLYVAPERLSQPSFKEWLATLPLSLVAVDEAHCISEWGHDFRPDYRLLSQLKETVPNVPIIALTATATRRVEQDIAASLHLKDPLLLRGSFDRKNLYYDVRYKTDSYGQIVEYLRGDDRGSGIIYCSSRKRVEEIAQKLKKDRFHAEAYHAGLAPERRAQVQEQFLRDDIPIMVATVAFGMGVDKPNIRFVIHYDLPKSMEGYYQETGRAGRDGLASDCVLFYSPVDKRMIQYFIDQIQDPQEQDRSRQKMDQIYRYASTVRCRRRQVLAYFGEAYTQSNCGACDVCGRSGVVVDATQLAYKVLSTIVRLGGRVADQQVIIDVLHGVENQVTLELAAQNLSVFGVGKDEPGHRIREAIGQLVDEGYLNLDFTLTEQSARALREREKILLKLSPEKPKPRPIQRKEEDAPRYDQRMWERLRAERKAIADMRNVPPYVIWSDRTLQEMAYHLPVTEEEMRNIHGVGDFKLEAYGQPFLDLIQRSIKELNLDCKATSGVG